jgi:hypothetical protein
LLENEKFFSTRLTPVLSPFGGVYPEGIAILKEATKLGN